MRTAVLDRSWRTCRVLGLLWALVAAPPDAAALAQSTCPAAVLTLEEAAALLRVDATELEQLAQAGEAPGRRVGSAWRFDCAAVFAWLRGDTIPLPAESMQAAAARGGTAVRSEPQAGQETAPAPGAQAAPIGEAPEERSAEDIFLRGNRVLLGRGEVVIDVGQLYSRSDAPQLVVVGNAVTLGTLQQSAFTTVLIGRVGVLRETEIFASTAFHKRSTRQLLGVATLGTTGDTRFGGTGIGLRHTVLHEAVRKPDVVLTLSGQLPSGDGLPAVSGGIVLVKSVDPVVLFANANYAHSFEHRIDGRDVTPTDAVDVSMGYGLALNDTVAISMGVGGLFTGATTIEGATTSRASAFTARFGLTTSLRQGLYLEPSISFSLSGPARSFAFGLTMPYAF